MTLLNLRLTAGPPELEHQVQRTHIGQAHWGGSGPPGKTCGDCRFLGYFRIFRNELGDAVKGQKVHGCAQFHRLTGAHGAIVPCHAPACKYFSPHNAAEGDAARQ